MALRVTRSRPASSYSGSVGGSQISYKDGSSGGSSSGGQGTNIGRQTRIIPKQESTLTIIDVKTGKVVRQGYNAPSSSTAGTNFEARQLGYAQFPQFKSSYGFDQSIYGGPSTPYQGTIAGRITQGSVSEISKAQLPNYGEVRKNRRISELRKQGYNEQEINYLVANDFNVVSRIAQPMTALEQMSFMQQRKEYNKYLAQEKAYENQVVKVEEQVSSYEASVKAYNERYGGKQLSESDYAKAVAEQGMLASQRTALESAISKTNQAGERVERLATTTTESIGATRKRYEGYQDYSDRTGAMVEAVGGNYVREAPLQPRKLGTTLEGPALPTGKKIEFESSGSLLSRGLIGTAIDVEADKFNPYNKEGLPEAVVNAVPYTALRFAGLGANIGQTLGASSTGKGDEYILTTTGKKRITGAGDLKKMGAMVGTQLTTNPIGFGVGLVGGVAKEITTDPLKFGAEALAFYSLGSFVGSGFSYIGQKTGLTKPIIKFKTSSIKSTRVGGGEKFVDIGKGSLKYTETTKLRQLLGKSPIERSVPVKYSFDVTKEFSTKALKVGKKIDVGSPSTLKDLIPDESLKTLFNLQDDTIKALKGRAGFRSEGVLEIGGDPFVIKEITGAFPKSVRVRTSFGDLFKLKDPFATYKFKVSTTGERGLSGAKVKGISLTDDLAKYSQYVRTEAGPKFNIDVVQLGGKIKGPFEVGKVGATTKSEFNLLKAMYGKKSAVDNMVKSSKGNLALLTDTGKEAVAKASLKVKDTAKYVIPIGETTKGAIVSKSISSSAKAFAKRGGELGVASELIYEYVPNIKVGEIPTLQSVVRVDTKAIDVTIPKYDFSKLNNTLSGTKEITKADTLLKYTTATRTDVSTIQDTAQIVVPKQAQKEVQAQQVKLSQLLRTDLKVQSPTLTAYKFDLRVKVPPPPTTRIYPSFQLFPVTEKLKKGLLKPAYRVTTRVGGKETLLGIGLPKGRALKLGSAYTREQTARSFKIKEVGLTRRKDVPLPRLTQFRKPKSGGRVAREGFTYVEKSKFAIDSPTELKEITYKGLLSKKSKQNKKIRFGKLPKVRVNAKALRLLRG